MLVTVVVNVGNSDDGCAGDGSGGVTGPGCGGSGGLVGVHAGSVWVQPSIVVRRVVVSGSVWALIHFVVVSGAVWVLESMLLVSLESMSTFITSITLSDSTFASLYPSTWPKSFPSSNPCSYLSSIFSLKFCTRDFLPFWYPSP
jgi:hypothetical protein